MAATFTPPRRARESPRRFLVEEVSVAQVKEPDWCNTNNHRFSELPTGCGETELDMPSYQRQHRRTRVDLWIDFIDALPAGKFSRIEFPRRHTALLGRAAQVGIFRGEISPMFEEDLAPCIDLLAERMHADLADGVDRLFIRHTECSPKDGIGGIGPYPKSREGASQMIRAMLTSRRCLKALVKDNEEQRSCVVYTLVWRENMAREYEWRCFVRNRSLTAISQYAWFEPLPQDAQALARGDLVSRIQDLLDRVLAFFDAKAVAHPDPHSTEDVPPADFVLDALCRPDAECAELVELNTFGAQQAAGAALFHWIRDYDAMYHGVEISDSDTSERAVPVRILVDNADSSADTKMV